MATTSQASDVLDDLEQITFSRREVAWLAGVSLRAVDRAIEEGVVRPRRRGRGALLDAHELAVLAVIGGVGLPLPREVKRRLRAALVRERPYLGAGAWELPISPNLVIRGDGGARELLERAARYARARQRWIESAPEVKGGEPVIAGTRIGVRALAGRLAAGDRVEDLAADYPDLPREAFETAAAWARCHPRRGRPARPWRT